MTLDLDAIEARLLEYNPDAPRCQKKVEEVRSYAPDHMEPDDPEYDDFKMVHRVPCCRPEGHEGECRSTRRVLGWPGYATLKELLAEVRRLRQENAALEAKLDACGQANLGLTYLVRGAEDEIREAREAERSAVVAWLTTATDIAYDNSDAHHALEAATTAITRGDHRKE